MNLPNLCKNSSLLIILIYTQILAISVYLISESLWSFEKLGYFSLYIQWLTLGSIFILCLCRNKINKLSSPKAYMAIILVGLMVFIIVESCFIYILSNLLLDPFEIWDSLRRFLAFLLLLFLALRLLNTLKILDRRGRAESEAKIEALQARIKPHFLFNSLNTISELISQKPDQAEKSVYALSKLFRAGLATNSLRHSLQDELSLCESYLELERWRLEKNLHVLWNINIEKPQKWAFPRLLLQPLLENCITHGADINGKVSIEADLRETKRNISVMISNECDRNVSKRTGNGIALDNIKERLFIMFDDNHTFKTRNTDDAFSVIIRIPKNSLNNL